MKMSLPDHLLAATHDNSMSSIEEKKPLSVQNSGRKERNVDTFLNGLMNRNCSISDIEANTDNATIKADHSHHSSLMSRSHSEIPRDIEDDYKTKSDIEDNDENSYKKNHSIDNCHSDRSAHKTPEIDNKTKQVISDRAVETDRSLIKEDMDNKIATPTITVFKKRDINTEQQKITHLENTGQKPPEYEDFTKKLTQMSNLIEQKDEEIKMLWLKLNKIKKRKSSSSSSSSSDESKKKAKIKKEKKNKKDKNKKSKNNQVHEDKNSDEKTEKTKDTSPRKHDEKDGGLKSQEIQLQQISPIESKEKIFNLKSNLNENQHPKTEFIDDKLAPDLKKKLDELEFEVRRLQQANVESISTLQKLRDNNILPFNPSNDVTVNQLLVDQNLLKEELKQLKLEHSKLTQPALLVEEIRQLKKDMKYLRKQNDILKQYTKHTSRSLNQITTSSHDLRLSKDNLNYQTVPDRKLYISNIPDSNNSSNYIYQKLQNNRHPTNEAPSVQSMLKHNIESMESPYYATCQSIQYSAPFSGGPSYRARKLSDSSTVLMEDIKPKKWVEKINQPVISQYNQLPNNYHSSTNYYYKDNDEHTEDSYVSITTSLTDRTDDDWRYDIRREKENNDLLSTQESEFSDNNTVRDAPNFHIKQRLDYSFTPKVPTDLNLDDYVKFARPGGKMSMGRVCFIGHLPGRSEICVGLELGEDAGKHDGVFEDTRYFQCRKNRGVFISFHKIILAYKSI